jgi:pimeloyl-ACP methyl ester carboxylesterase
MRAPNPRPWSEAAWLLRGLAGLSTFRVCGTDLPRGSSPVLVLPGFLTGDASTAPLRRFLSRLGYQVSGWGLGRNRGDVEALVPLVEARLAALYPDTPVSLVGWSLGGVLARETARRAPARVRRVVTLGTPVVGGPKYTLAAKAYRRRGIDVDAIERLAAEMNRTPLGVPVTAIYSRKDSVVAWQACIDDNPANDVDYVEVRTGHAELGYSPVVYREVARALARGAT